eukprot:472532-Prymnesium_polylepis.1
MERQYVNGRALKHASRRGPVKLVIAILVLLFIAIVRGLPRRWRMQSGSLRAAEHPIRRTPHRSVAVWWAVAVGHAVPVGSAIGHAVPGGSAQIECTGNGTRQATNASRECAEPKVFVCLSRALILLLSRALILL